jgi:hypothetical protein
MAGSEFYYHRPVLIAKHEGGVIPVSTQGHRAADARKRSRPVNDDERLRQEIRKVFKHQPLGAVDARALAEILANSGLNHRQVEEIETMVRQVAVSMGQPLADPPKATDD